MSRFLQRTLAVVAAGALSLAATATGLGVATVAALPLIADQMSLELSRVVLSDGKRQVQMQGMAHLAAPEFYDDVAALVAQRRAEGWLVFYEEVRNDLPDPQAGMAAVLNRLGAEWQPAEEDRQHPYQLLAPLLGEGLVLQNNMALLGGPGPEVRNIDVTLSTLLATLEPRPEEQAGAQNPVDLRALRSVFDDMPDWAKARVRAALKIMLAKAASAKFVQERLPRAITAQREEMVVAAIEAEPHRDILILYGQLHLNPIESRLKASDPDWRVVSREALRAF